MSHRVSSAAPTSTAPTSTAPTTAAPRRFGRARASVAVVSALYLVAFGVATFLPGTAGIALSSIRAWSLVIPVILLIVALCVRARIGLAAATLGALLWGAVYVPQAMPADATVRELTSANDSAASDAAAAPPACEALEVLSQNVGTDPRAASDLAATALAEGVGIVAMQELNPAARDAAAALLDPSYGEFLGVGTVGFWSLYPVSAFQPLDLGLGWIRAVYAEVDAPGGTIGLYVVHAASVRPGQHDERDRMLGTLAADIAQNANSRLLVLGDFNAGSDDPALAPLGDVVSEPRQQGGGFGFSWPAQLPLIRLDHIFARGFSDGTAVVHARNASDHRPISAVFRGKC